MTCEPVVVEQRGLAMPVMSCLCPFWSLLFVSGPTHVPLVCGSHISTTLSEHGILIRVLSGVRPTLQREGVLRKSGWVGLWHPPPPPPVCVGRMRGTGCSVPSFRQLIASFHPPVFAPTVAHYHQVGEQFLIGLWTLDSGKSIILMLFGKNKHHCASGTFPVGTLHQWLGEWVGRRGRTPPPPPWG